MRNMKRFSKILAVLVCVLLAVGVIFTLSSCKNKCDHINTETKNSATCTAAGVETIVCLDCGELISETPVEALGHYYEDDTAASVAATCTTDGKDVDKCIRCNNTKETVVVKLGHNYQLDAGKCVAATCTAAGVEVKTCTACASEVKIEIAQLQHTLSTSVTKNATCTAAGEEVTKCSSCSLSTTKVIDALGHNWQTLSGAPAVACLTSKCEHCQETRLPSASHSHTLKSNTATCEANGVATYECVCGDTYTTDTPPLGHYVKTWTANPTTVGSTCEKTFSQSGTCSHCSNTITESYTSEAHNYVLTVTKEATCNEPGHQQMKCTECNKINESAGIVEFYGEHTFGAFSAADNNGKMTSTCSTCGEVRTKFTEGSAATVTKEELKKEVELSSGAVVKLDEQSANALTDPNATLNANSYTKDQLTDDVDADSLNKLSDDDIVYNLTLTGSEGAITNFEGIVTVKLPYTLKDGEDPTRITIFYLDGTEIIEMLAVFTATSDDGKTGFVTFETNHFSYYLVGLYSNAGVCERFGHEYIVAYLEPTCTKGGYHIQSCKRCGSFGINETYSPTGHSTTVQGTSVPATCTTAGHEDRKCETCGCEFTAFIAPTGHAWIVEAGNDTPATCGAPGAKIYTCEHAGCEETYTETFAQLSHKLVKVTTAPTCTSTGYTTYTCSLCETYSYVSDYTAALGHTWNIAAPTCSDGQICIVCSAAGNPATGNHTMSNGKCTVCGFGCDHALAVKETVEPTCDKGGYTVYVCSKCAAEVTKDYTNAKGHSYTDSLLPCETCGKANPDAEEILSSFSVKIENFKVSASTVTTVTGKNPSTSIEGGSIVDLYEIYLVVSDDRILVYADGSAKEKEGAEDFRITVYGDGEYLYVRGPFDVTPDPVATDDHLETIRLSYNDMIGNMTGGDFAASDISISEALEQMLAMAYADEMLAPWMEFLATNGDNMNAAVKDAVLSFFIAEETSEGTKYTLDIDVINSFNDDLKTLTVAELIDKYCGEDTFAKIITLLRSFETKTLAKAASELVDVLDSQGIPSALVLSTINAYMTDMYGETFDLMAMLNSSDYRNMTVSEFIMMILSSISSNNGTNDNNNGGGNGDINGENGGNGGMAPIPTPAPTPAPMSADASENELPSFKEIVDLIEATLNTTIIYELIPDEDTSAQIYDFFDKIISSEIFNIYLVLDENDNLVSGGFVINESDILVFTETESNDDGSFVKTEEGWLNIAGNVTFKAEATLPQGADSVKKDYLVGYDKLMSSINAALADPANEGQLVLCANGNTVYSIVLRNNIPYIAQINMSSMKTYEALLSKLNFIITPDCTDSYHVYASNEVMLKDENQNNISVYFSVNFYFNAKTNTFSTESAHDFSKEYTGTLPSGTYLTFDEAPCGSYYGKYYVCDCGTISRDSHYKSHDSSSVVTLLPGSETCRDGVLIEYVCRYCGDISSSYVTHSHDMGLDEIIEIPTEHGILHVEVRGCACGFNTELNYNTNGKDDVVYCQFGGETSEPIYNAQNEIVGYKSTSNCAIQGCTAKIICNGYSSVTPSSFTGMNCVYEKRAVYEIYYNGLKCKEIVDHNYRQIHSWVTDSEDTYLSNCSECGAQKYDMYIYDAFGRRIEYLYWEKENGEYITYTHNIREYISDNTCEFYSGYSYEPGVEPEINYSHTNTSHDHWGVVVTQAATCTQPAIYYYGCRFCGYQSSGQSYGYYDSYGSYIGSGHKWNPTGEDGDRAYHCSRCDLYSGQGSSDIALEDLTNHQVYSEDNSIVIGCLNRYTEYNIMFSFVNNDASYTDDGSTLPASLISYTYNTFYQYSGRIVIDLDSIIESIELLLDDANVTTNGESVEDFLANYDLAITVQEYQSGEYGDSYQGAYSVLVLENLANYFAN